jgi:hypothetical protein
MCFRVVVRDFSSHECRLHVIVGLLRATPL